MKSKITKILNSEENQFGKSIITWQNQITIRIKNEWTLKTNGHQKRMDIKNEWTLKTNGHQKRMDIKNEWTSKTNGY